LHECLLLPLLILRLLGGRAAQLCRQLCQRGRRACGGSRRLRRPLPVPPLLLARLLLLPSLCCPYFLLLAAPALPPTRGPLMLLVLLLLPLKRCKVVCLPCRQPSDGCCVGLPAVCRWRLLPVQLLLLLVFTSRIFQSSCGGGLLVLHAASQHPDAQPSTFADQKPATLLCRPMPLLCRTSRQAG
jgi:hypothetical protein